MSVPILKQGAVLIAAPQGDLADMDWRELQTDLLERIGMVRATGVVLDVSALDILDSYATRTLRNIAMSTRLRGANTVIVGIQPEVALAMVRLGLGVRLSSIETALDLEDGLLALEAWDQSGD